MSAVDAPLPPGSRPSLRLVVNLNAALHAQLAAERAAAEVIGPDVAHHLVDPDGLLGLDPVRATDLDEGFGPAAGRGDRPVAAGACRSPVRSDRCGARSS